LLGVTLRKADDFAPHQINGWNNLHVAHLVTALAKFLRICKPTSPDFSG
jgi:hypothetical protein